MSTVTNDFQRLVTHLSERPLPHPVSSASDPLAAVRDRTRARLAESHFDPEEWSYTDVSSVVAGLAEVIEKSETQGSAQENGGTQVVIGERSDLPLSFVLGGAEGDAAPSRVSRGGATIYRAARQGSETGSTAAEQLGSLSAQSENPLIRLNSAFFSDAIVVHIPRGTVCEEVLRVVHVVSSDRSVFPRTLVVAEEGSSITVIEELVVVGKEGPRNPAVSEILLAPGAHCSYTRLVTAPVAAQQLSAVFVRADRDARFRSFFMNTGGALIRNEVYPSLVGAGAEVQVSGLALGNEKQRVDTVVSMEHAAPHCQSRQLFKGIYAGQSAGAFSGTIIVQEGAQKTNAFQSSKSILLSPDAAVYTKPQLKIWADDVKCSHGATVGQIDEDALFYLRSRGIPVDTARILLVHAFVGEVLAEIDSPVVRSWMSEVVEQRLSELLSS